MKQLWSDWPKEILYYGSPALLPQPLVLHAGSLKMIYENGNIRQIKYRDFEVIRMIYSAVRDQNWGTVDFVIESEDIQIKDDGFKISYTATYRDVFMADCQLEGTSDGVITFSLDGEVLNDFRKNRIGFCVLHPVEECMGKECIINYADQDAVPGKFPSAISPDAPFKNIRSMKWNVLDDLEGIIDFEGDIFETEDQRNWTDASYKTFCTPLDLPFPLLVKKGTAIRQKIVFCLSGNKIISSNDQATFNSIDCDFTKTNDFPELGLAQSSENIILTLHEIAAIRDIRLDHLRCDIHPGEDNSLEKLVQAFDESNQIDCKLELCLHFSSHFQEEFNNIKQLLKSRQYLIKSVVLFRKEKKTTDNELLKALVPIIREILPSAQIGAGTDAFFSELNMHRMKTDLLDFVIYSVNPQVHAFDNQSLIESLLVQKHTVQSTRLFSGKADIFVSPVTLKMRFNPDAISNELVDIFEGFPGKADARQMSLFNMGWTVGSLASLISVNTSSITYFETVGLSGVMQGDRINRFPDVFYSVPRMFYPVYHLFKILCSYKHGKVHSCRLSDPKMFSALMLTMEGECVLIISNLTIDEKRLNMSFDHLNYNKIARFSANTFSQFAFDSNYMEKAIPFVKIGCEINLLPFETIVLFSFPNRIQG